MQSRWHLNVPRKRLQTLLEVKRYRHNISELGMLRFRLSQLQLFITFVFFPFVFFARPTDQLPRGRGRWETKTFIGMA